MRTLLAIIFCGCLVIAPCAADSSWSGTEADQMISFDDNEYARAVQIHFSEWYLSLHAFWGEDSPSVRELHYGRSVDDGLTWTSTSADRVISFPDGNDLYEQCDVAGEEALIVVWSEDHDSGMREVHYGVSLDEGATWSSQSADGILSDPGTLADTGVPSITCDGEGVFHVVWNQTTPTGVSEVHYAHSADNGATWSSSAQDRVISFPDGNPAITPKIVAYGNRLIVAWREVDAAGVPRIHAGVSSDGGDTWSCETADHEVSQPVTLIADLDAAGDWLGANGVYVVYKATHDTASPYYYEIHVTSTYDGVTWTGQTEEIVVSYDEGAGRSASNPDVYVGYFAMPIVVWDEEDDVTGTQEAHCSIAWDGLHWSGAERDSIISFPDGENGYRPAVTGANWIVDPGRPGLPRYWVAWTEFAGGASDNYEVHLSIFYASAGAVGEDPPPLARPIRGAPSPSADVTRFEFTLAEPGRARVEIFNPAGRLVRAMSGEFGAGSASLSWDGCDGRGRAVRPGRYLARIRSGQESRTVSVVRF